MQSLLGFGIKMDKTYFIANIRHIAWVAFQIAAGQLYNEQINKDQFDSLVDAIVYQKANPNVTLEENHNNWMRMKRKQGWVYGETKDSLKKTHPDLVPFNELPTIEKRKDVSDIVVHRLASQLIDELDELVTDHKI